MSEETFVPASPLMTVSGERTVFRDLILLGVLNGLLVAMSHLIYLLYFPIGGFVLQFYHQCFENLLLAGIYLLMAFKAPRTMPFTLNAAIWSGMGLMMGYWPMLPVALPAGMAVDWINRRAAPALRMRAVLAGFAVYTTLLCAAQFWPYLLLRQSGLIRRMSAMDPVAARIVEAFTLPLFGSQMAATFVTALIGGSFALKLMRRHFVPAGVV